MFRVPNAPWITSDHNKGSMKCGHCGEEWNHTRHPTPETFLAQLARFGRTHRDCPPPDAPALMKVGA